MGFLEKWRVSPQEWGVGEPKGSPEHRRSTGGAALAAGIAGRLRGIDGAPWFGDVRIKPTYNDKPTAGSGAWLYRAHGCYDEVYHGPANISAVLVECGFITDPNLRSWWADRSHRLQLADRIVQTAIEWTGHERKQRKHRINV